MSKKLTIEVIERAAKQTGIDDAHRVKLLEMLADMTADESDEEKPPAIKKQFVVILSDPVGRFTPEFMEASGLGALVCWVVQIPEDASPHTAPNRIYESAHHFNTTKKGRLLPVQTVGETLENVGGKITEEQGLWIKTRVPVYAMPVNGEIPGTPSILSDADRGIKNMSVTIRTKDAAVRVDADGIHNVTPAA